MNLKMDAENMSSDKISTPDEESCKKYFFRLSTNNRPLSLRIEYHGGTMAQELSHQIFGWVFASHYVGCWNGDKDSCVQL